MYNTHWSLIEVEQHIIIFIIILTNKTQIIHLYVQNACNKVASYMLAWKFLYIETVAPYPHVTWDSKQVGNTKGKFIFMHAHYLWFMRRDINNVYETLWQVW